jgi:hypothetical protein
MKTTLKPRMKVSELIMTERSSLRSASWSVSTLAPEMREIYPGTNGSTHGDKNEMIPARKAAIGKGRLCIDIYSS